MKDINKEILNKIKDEVDIIIAFNSYEIGSDEQGKEVDEWVNLIKERKKTIIFALIAFHMGL